MAPTSLHLIAFRLHIISFACCLMEFFNPSRQNHSQSEKRVQPASSGSAGQRRRPLYCIPLSRRPVVSTTGDVRFTVTNRSRPAVSLPLCSGYYLLVMTATTHLSSFHPQILLWFVPLWLYRPNGSNPPRQRASAIFHQFTQVLTTVFANNFTSSHFQSWG